MTFNPPQGPAEMHPIQGTSDLHNNVKDFRPKAPAQTAFQKEMQLTAFKAEQSKANRARNDAQADADKLFGEDTGEPRTAFELEMRGGRRPLGATEPVEPSLFDPPATDQTSRQPTQVTPASVEKEKPSPPAVPEPPKPPSPSTPKSGQEKPSA